mmetsp:Transcript_114579/g.324550  ORF Transcript_114579/g.324550 Transcript_114579/m.324550 type:complete len:246 (+) Transcript_114579:475-1212(+)
MGPVVALRAESVAAGARQVAPVVTVVQEHLLLAALPLAGVDVGVVPGEELEELVVGALGQALLEDVDGVRGAEAVAAPLGGAAQLAQPALADDIFEVEGEALETEAVLAGQRAAALHLVVDEADGAPEHGPVLLALSLQLLDELRVLQVHVPDAPLGRGQVARADHAAQVAVAEVLRAAGHLRGAPDAGEAAEGGDPVEPEPVQAAHVGLVAAVQRLERVVLPEADDTRDAEGSTDVPRLRDVPH